MLNLWYVIAVIILLFFTVFLSRALPFLFGKRMADNQLLNYLGDRLPTCVFALLVIYFMMAMARPEHWHNLPWQLSAIVIVILLHLRWRNVTLSVLGGTIAYLFLDLLQ